MHAFGGFGEEALPLLVSYGIFIAKQYTYVHLILAQQLSVKT